MVTTDKKGKILKVKIGYNPNSSSMGSMIFILPAALLGITVIFGAISGVIFSLFLKKTEENSKKEEKSEKNRNEDKSFCSLFFNKEEKSEKKRNEDE
jgi:hypothetical protein